MPPAVTFTAQAFSAWLRELNKHGFNNLYSAGLAGTHTIHGDEDDASVIAENALLAVHGVPQVWELAPDVSGVSIWRTAGEEGADYGGLLTVTVDGVELVIGHCEADDLISGESGQEMPRWKAARMALQQIAARVNEAVAAYRARTGCGEVVERHLMIHGVTTEEQFRALEAAIGVTEGGRFTAGGGILLNHRDHNLDAAIRWARDHGFAVEQTDTTRIVG
ncbi:hypothetical protein [Micromonospora haikouensis]|uniref:hypothetical protein n=1 Tax=Micromonospora haikouensis TaxID=686309 RepID=UPI003D721426